MKDKGFITNSENSKQKYVVCFSGNTLLRGMIYALKENGFIPENEVI